MEMTTISATEWRSSLGTLRQGGDVIVVLYRRRPAALMIPLPPAWWEDAAPFVKQIMQFRNNELQNTHAEWIGRAREPVRFNVEEARRSSARLFGHTMNHAPVIITFYTHDNAVMLPVPPDISRANLEAIYSEVTKLIA